MGHLCPAVWRFGVSGRAFRRSGLMSTLDAGPLARLAPVIDAELIATEDAGAAADTAARK